jgi:DNA-binding MarR family transcriptional regulator
MKPFLSLAADPVVVRPPKRLTAAAQLRAAMIPGEWVTRKELATRTGLGDGTVNTFLQDGVRRGFVEKETAELSHRCKTVTQRYRALGGMR